MAGMQWLAWRHSYEGLYSFTDCGHLREQSYEQDVYPQSLPHSHDRKWKPASWQQSTGSRAARSQGVGREAILPTVPAPCVPAVMRGQRGASNGTDSPLNCTTPTEACECSPSAWPIIAPFVSRNQHSIDVELSHTCTKEYVHAAVNADVLPEKTSKEIPTAEHSPEGKLCPCGSGRSSRSAVGLRESNP